MSFSLILDAVVWAAEITRDHLGDEAVSGLLAKLKEECHHLERMDEKLSDLASSDFRAGTCFLEDAFTVKNPRQRQRLIEEALRSLTLAASRNLPLIAPRAKLLVGVCYAILGERTTSERWLASAFDSTMTATAHVDELVGSYFGLKRVVRLTSSRLFTAREEEGLMSILQEVVSLVQLQSELCDHLQIDINDARFQDSKLAAQAKKISRMLRSAVSTDAKQIAKTAPDLIDTAFNLRFRSDH